MSELEEGVTAKAHEDFLAYLERKRLEKMRDATKRSLGAKDVVVPAPEDKKGVCFFAFTNTSRRASNMVPSMALRT